MTKQTFLDLLESPYAETAWNQAVPNSRWERLALEALKPISEEVSLEEAYEFLKNLYFSLTNGEERMIASNLMALLEATGRIPKSIVYHFYLARELEGYLSIGVAFSKDIRNTREFKAADYAKLLGMWKDSRFRGCPTLAYSWGRNSTINEIKALKYFYYLPKASLKIRERDFLQATRIYKCKEHPDLLFVKWNRPISMNDQQEFLDWVAKKTDKDFADDLEWLILSETAEKKDY